jgi:ABC-type oligopeptide transport system substrate-binding subunit
MMLGLRAAATASAFLIALSGGSMALAQKQGGILRMSHFDSPASMSMHEEATGAINRPMMGVFNNLVMYKEDETKNSVQSIAPDLASGWSWSEDGTPTDLPAARVLAMGDPSPPQKRAFAGVRIEPWSAICR